MAGGLARDRAGDKMDKTLERLARRGSKPQRNETILEQIQRAYPHNWQEVLEEWQREDTDPEYREKKETARKQFWSDYSREVPPYLRSETPQEGWVRKKMTEWVRNQRP